MKNDSKIYPLWYRQITYQKKNRIITYGLTIPYLIGSYQICGETLPKNPIEFLILEIINTDLDQCAVIQKCPYIRKYVVGVEQRQFCETYMRKEIQFKNSKGQTTLIVTQNAKELGNDFKGLINQFEKLYKPYTAISKFTWNNKIKSWENFTQTEIEIIKKVK